MNIIKEQRSNIRRFGKIALLGLIFGAALALMFALTALAEEPPESTETTPPIEEPVVEETTPPIEEPVVEETTVPEEEPVVEETTIPVEEPVVDETTAPESEPVVEETIILEEELAEESVDANSVIEPESVSGPSIATYAIDDTPENDFAPEETVVVKGSGLATSTEYVVKVTRPDGSVVIGDGSFTSGSDTVVSDENGNILYNYQLDGIAGEYLIEILDSNGTVVTTLGFFDGTSYHLQSKDYGSSVWSPGNAHGYTEGDLVPFRLQIKNPSQNTPDGTPITMGAFEYNSNIPAYGIVDIGSIYLGYDNGSSVDSSLAELTDISLPYIMSGGPNIDWLVFDSLLLVKTSSNPNDYYIYWKGLLAITGVDHNGDSFVDNGASYWQGATLHALVVEPSGRKTVPIKDPAIFSETPDLLGSISGYKFSDIDKDQSWDGDEPGLGGWVILLFSGFRFLDKTTTEDDGYYIFTGLSIGKYSLLEVPQLGWVCTYPNILGFQQVRISECNLNVTHVNFGNFGLGRISGSKFEDVDGNGNWDIGEPTIGNWEIVLTGFDSNGNPVSMTRSTRSLDGFYVFTGIGPGTYIVSETLQDGWMQKYPGSGSYDITLTICHMKDTGNDFGNFKIPPSLGGGPTPSLAIAGITEIAGVKRAGALKVAGITELPFTGSNLVLVYLIAILMIISGTAILASSRKVKVNRARL
jgi:hypothetical protein